MYYYELVITMLLVQQRFVFGSHIDKLKRISFPGQKRCVDSFVDQYVHGEKTFRKYPALTLSHWFLEHTVEPKKDDRIIAAEEVPEHRTQVIFANGQLQAIKFKGAVVSTSSMLCVAASAFVILHSLSPTLSEKAELAFTALSGGFLALAAAGFFYSTRMLKRVRDVLDQTRAHYGDAVLILTVVRMPDKREPGNEPPVN